MADTGSCPVAGRPRFFRTTGIDFLAIIVLRKSEPVRSANFSPALTQATEIPMAQANSTPTPVHDPITGADTDRPTNPVGAAAPRHGVRARRSKSGAVSFDLVEAEP